MVEQERLFDVTPVSHSVHVANSWSNPMNRVARKAWECGQCNEPMH
jgi:hypothetical protein